jgi:hypothetical protein
MFQDRRKSNTFSDPGSFNSHMDALLTVDECMKPNTELTFDIGMFGPKFQMIRLIRHLFWHYTRAKQHIFY